VPGVDASPSALPPIRPGSCTHVPGISVFALTAVAVGTVCILLCDGCVRKVAYEADRFVGAHVSSSGQKSLGKF